MSLKHGLLGFLSSHEMSGYDLEKLFSNSIGFFWNAKISQVYRDLHSMEKAGWVKSREVTQSGRPNKKVFSITYAGLEEFDRWLTNYDVKYDFEVRVGILMRMFFAANKPKKESIALLERFHAACCKALDALNNVHEALSCYDDEEVLYPKITLSYGEKYYKMQMEWCAETIDKLQNIEREK